ncbi:uncharacterized protein LOC134190348 [Corticium candelabrum]|uniref:uncharacterized protein LOC134190348 n=1 Tax=Corticium candelabrum TaxID=121492 RepID=UPI002E26E2B6|nr:uncharacterized protein LOC134190348 [Corticium candelabrum]
MIRCWQESAKRQKLESPSDSNCSGSVDGKLACMGEPVEDKAARNVVQQEVAKVVVRVLSPYYANKQIATKDLFKALARKIHICCWSVRAPASYWIVVRVCVQMW